MKTIELIGPSGAGKTTYVNKSFNGSGYYINPYRVMYESFSFGSTLRHMDFKSTLIRWLFNYYKLEFAKEFVIEHPDILEPLRGVLENYEDRGNILDLAIREMSWYEIHSRNLGENCTYVIDDGLYQIHLRLLKHDNWSAARLIDHLPEPDMIVFVNTPTKVCLQRQESRQRGRAKFFRGMNESKALKELDQIQTFSEMIITEAKKRGISVRLVDNR